MSIEHGQMSLEVIRTGIAQLTPEQVTELTAELLAGREPGRQPLPLFTELARLSTIGTVELAPIRDASRKRPPQILLSKRPDDDPFWHGLWHLPGKVITPRVATSQTIRVPMEELADDVLKNEFTGIARTGELDLFDSHVRTGVRGTELTAFCVAPVDLQPGYTEPGGGTFFSLETVLEEIRPDEMISGHPETLLKAMKAYKRGKR